MKEPRILRCAIVMLLGLGMLARQSAAQGVTAGSLAGVVVDPQGAVTPGATVVAIWVVKVSGEKTWAGSLELSMRQ